MSAANPPDYRQQIAATAADAFAVTIDDSGAHRPGARSQSDTATDSVTDDLSSDAAKHFRLLHGELGEALLVAESHPPTGTAWLKWPRAMLNEAGRGRMIAHQPSAP